jgi:hypothetical protein
LQSAASYRSLLGLKMGHPLAQRFFVFFGVGGWDINTEHNQQ